MENVLVRKLRGLLNPPDLGDVELNHRARLQLRILSFLFPITLLFGILFAILGNAARVGLYLAGFALVVEAGAFVLSFRGRVEAAGRVIIYFLWAVEVLAIYFFDGVSGPTVMGQVLLIFTAGLLQGEQMGIALTVMTVLVNLGTALVQGESQLTGIWLQLGPLARWSVQSMFFLMAVTLSILAVRSIRRGLVEAASSQAEMKQRVDELRKAQQALNRSEELYHGILEDQVDIICRFRPDGTLTYANHAFLKFFKVEADRLSQANYWTLIPPEAVERVKLKIRGLGPDDPVATSEAHVMLAGSNVHWQEWTDRGIFDEAGELIEVQSLGRDVTEQVELKQRLENSLSEMETIAMTDALTGAMSRLAITEELEAEWHRSARENNPLSVALLDVDELKAINDKFGHLAGDEALKTMAQVLRNGLRRYDRLGRWGGDEFLILFPATEINEAMAVARRLRDLVKASQGQMPDGTKIQLRASLGVAIQASFLDSEATMDRLIARADKALYRAKQLGKDRVEMGEAKS